MIKGRRAAALRARDDQDRRRPRRAHRARRAPERIPRRASSSRSRSAAYPYGEWPRRCSATSGRSPKTELKLRAFRGVAAGHRRRPGRSRVLLRPLPAGRRRASSTSRSTPPAIPCRADLPPTEPLAGHSLEVTLDLGLQQEAEKALLEGHRTRGRAANRRPRARSWRWTRATGKSSRSAPTRASTRTSSPNR